VCYYTNVARKVKPGPTHRQPSATSAETRRRIRSTRVVRHATATSRPIIAAIAEHAGSGPDRLRQHQVQARHPQRHPRPRYQRRGRTGTGPRQFAMARDRSRTRPRTKLESSRLHWRHLRWEAPAFAIMVRDFGSDPEIRTSHMADQRRPPPTGQDTHQTGPSGPISRAPRPTSSGPSPTNRPTWPVRIGDGRPTTMRAGRRSGHRGAAALSDCGACISRSRRSTGRDAWSGAPSHNAADPTEGLSPRCLLEVSENRQRQRRRQQKHGLSDRAIAVLRRWRLPPTTTPEVTALDNLADRSIPSPSGTSTRFGIAAAGTAGRSASVGSLIPLGCPRGLGHRSRARTTRRDRPSSLSAGMRGPSTRCRRLRAIVPLHLVHARLVLIRSQREVALERMAGSPVRGLASSRTSTQPCSRWRASTSGSNSDWRTGPGRRSSAPAQRGADLSSAAAAAAAARAGLQR
jgi:hypothetical protein